MVEQESLASEGFTLVEMLVALALASVVLAFAIGSLSTSMRVFDSMARMNQSSRIDAAVQRLRSMISQTWLATSVQSGDGLARLLFDGRETSLEFATISEGFALEGGLIRMRIELDCNQDMKPSCRLIARTAIHRPQTDQVVFREPVTILAGLSTTRIRYFGRQHANEQSVWHDRWQKQDRLPQAVSLIFVFDDRNAVNAELFVQLHNAAP